MEYSNEIKIVINYALEEAARLGSYIATPDHLFLGILRYKDSDAVSVLTGLGADVKKMKQDIEAKIMASEPVPFERRGNVSLSEKSQEIIASCGRLHLAHMTPAHLMAEIFTNWSGACTTALENSNISLEKIPEAIRSLIENTVGDEPGQPEPASGEKASASMLDAYGYDLTAAARSGQMDPVVGRDAQIERIAQILSRRKKNNPVLIGEPGAGKSAIVEGLAQRIAEKKVPVTLAGKRIVSLDLGALVAGTKYRGQFEERLKSIVSQVKKDPDIILFIDELHTLVGAGSAPGSLDAANLLKPALARGEVQCIGATTLDEYREHIEKDAALERRFQKVIVQPTSFDETLAILQGIKGRYEEFHCVKYDEAALKACISLTQRYVPDRCLPDKAIDVLDEAGARAHISAVPVSPEASAAGEEMAALRQEKREAARSGDFRRAAELHVVEKEKEAALEALSGADGCPVRSVTEDDIASVVSVMTGVPATKVASGESARLLRMESELKGVVVGQDEALGKVVRAIRRSRAGLRNPGKPIGTFLFLGPTGVGKTHLAKKIAEFLFDSPDNLIRIDMSEYGEKFSSSRLVGAPPGYVGYNEGGQLSEQVRRKPYSVVLLDEVEKAHPDIFNMLLQVLDEGRLTDSAGRYIDFRNTVLILTSNIGSREMRDFGSGVGFVTDASGKGQSVQARKSIIDKALGKVFTPEFLNRLDEQVYFNSLSKEDILKIIDIELADILGRLRQMGYTLSIAPSARKFIADEGFDPQMGARPLKRALQRYVEDPVSEAILAGVPSGAHFSVTLSRNHRHTVVKY